MENLLISYNDFSIHLVSNDLNVLKAIKIEFEDYYKFNDIKKNNNNKIMLVCNKELYDKYINKNMVSSKLSNKVVLIKDRDAILLYDKRDNNITILYKAITEDVMQFIGEVILSIFGKNIEGKGYYFFHSACVAIHGNAVGIIGQRNAGKTALMCTFLQNGFEFIANSRIGIKCEDEVTVIGLPSRVGIRYETINKVFSEKAKEKFIKVREEEYRRRRKKMNITVKEIKHVFEAEVISQSKLKIILFPVYIPESDELKIIKMEDREIIDILLKNKKSGVYDTVKYIDNFYHTNKPNFKFEDFKEIKFLKVIINERSSKKLVDLIMNGFKNEK